MPAAFASAVAWGASAGWARVIASAYAAIAWRCDTVCQYQPPATSATTTSAAAPAMIKVRPVGRVSVIMPLSYAKSSTILPAAGAAALPALRGAAHEMAAVRAALVRDPADDQTDAGHQPRSHHHRGVHRVLRAARRRWCRPRP